MDGLCSNCGHEFHARCTRCGREYGCGSLSIVCGHKDCDEKIIPFNSGELEFRQEYYKISYDVPKSDPEWTVNGLEVNNNR
jgi:hypothetical protein